MEFLGKYYRFIILGIAVLVIGVAAVKYSEVPGVEDKIVLLKEGKSKKEVQKIIDARTIEVEREVVGILLVEAWILMSLVAAGCAFIYVRDLISNRSFLIRVGSGIIFLAVVFGITYGSASEDMSSISTKIEVGVDEFKMVGALIGTTWVLALFGAATLFGFEIKKLIKP